MCFSPETSLTTAAALIPVGSWCLYTASKRLPEFRGFAIIPVGFGLQQFAVGPVWVGLERQRSNLVIVGSAIYLFFALAFWPLWFPIASAIAEPSSIRRKVMGLWFLLGLIWVVVIYLPMQPTKR